MTHPQREAVVLIHGLWLSGWCMRLLARRLTQAGYLTRTFSYPSRHADLRANAGRLNDFLATVPGDTVHLVGHSLGGILIRALFHYHPQQRPGRIVTLGSPHRGSVAGQRMARSGLGRRLMGRSVAQLLAGEQDAWILPPREIGVIRGDRGIGLGRLMRVPAPNDGLLTLEEAALPGATDLATVSVAHSALILSRHVAVLAVSFISSGRFGC